MLNKFNCQFYEILVLCYQRLNVNITEGSRYILYYTILAKGLLKISVWYLVTGWCVLFTDNTDSVWYLNLRLFIGLYKTTRGFNHPIACPQITHCYLLSHKGTWIKAAVEKQVIVVWIIYLSEQLQRRVSCIMLRSCHYCLFDGDDGGCTTRNCH